MAEIGSELSAHEGDENPTLGDRARLELVLQRVADGITVQNRAGEVVYANDAAARLIGFDSAADVIATPVDRMMERFELVDEHGGPFPLDELPGRRALAGEASERLVGYRIKETGEVLWSIVSATPVYGDDGEVELAVNVFHDITERREQEARVAFLARAGEVLSQSLDYARTLAEVARQAVPTVADWCMIYIQDDSGAIRRIAVEHFAGRHEGVLEQLEDFQFDPNADVGVPAVLRTGEPQLHAHATSQLVASDVIEGERLAADLEELGIRSWMCVPLTARGRTFGAMSFLSTESRRTFGAGDLELAQELARRAAVAVDNARLYQQAQQSVGQLEAVLGSAPVGIGFWDTDIRYVRVNPALAELNRLSADEHLGKTLQEVIPNLADALEPVYRRVVETGEPLIRHEASTDLAVERLGEERHWLSTYFPVKTPDGTTLGVGAVIMEITERKRAEDEAAARARQQADVAALGQLALTGEVELDALMARAADQVARMLGVEFVEVLELDSEADVLRLSYGVGWREGLVGSATVPTGLGSHGGYTLHAAGPVTVEDFAVEKRFKGSPLLHDHHVRSGVSVVIEGAERPYGALGAHTAVPRRFTQDDINYLQAVANVLGAAVDRRRLDENERLARERLAFIAEASRLLVSTLDYETTLRNLADLAHAPIADWILVYLLDEEGQLRRIVGRHADPALEPLVEELVDGYPQRLDDVHPVGRVVREGESILIPELTDELLAAGAHGERHLDLLRGLGLTSALSVPIVATGEPLGAIGFSRSGGPNYTAADVAVAEELGRRAGLAIENARLYETAEAARREAEARAQAALALRFVGDGVLLIDPANVVRLWNPAAETITGLRAEDVVGRRAEDALAGWATLAERVPLARAEAGALSVARPETLPLEVGGRELWLSISGVVFTEGTVFAFRDVTEERGVEKLKSDFVSTISHELRTPLAAIYGAALTLRREDVPRDGDEQGELLTVISDEAERLARIVSDILWTSRIESGGLQVTIEECDAAELARTVVQAARLHAPADLAVELHAPAELPRVAADPDKVRQVLSNLVDNAIKYSPDGGVVEVSIAAEDAEVCFRVRDRGLGIPPREHERIFEKFYRLDPNLTRGVGGTGLGLYICRELIQRMGGTIRVTSEEGGGSTFSVGLPAADVDAHALR
jgi:hypothetical protein